MFTRVTASGIGPHADLDLTLPTEGVAEIRGASESGKSLLVDIVCWCLWGTGRDGRHLPDALLRDGAEAMEASISLASGKRILRRRKAGGTDTIRIAVGDGESIRVDSQKELNAILKGLGDSTLGRAVLVPFAWRELAESAGGGRALRELLDAALPGPSAADLLARELQPGEPRDSKAADAARRAARKAADTAAGAAQEAARAVEQLVVPAQPDPARVAAARQALAQHEATKATAQDALGTLRAWRVARDAYEAREREVADHAARAKRLERPVSDRPAPGAEQDAVDALRAVEVTERDALAAHGRAAADERAIRAELVRIDAALARSSVPAEADPCAGVALGACQIAARAAEERRAALAHRQQLADERTDAEARLSAATTATAVASAELDAARAALDAPRERHRRASTSARAWAHYDSAIADLGPAPAPLPDPGEAPAVPTVAPLPADVLATIRDADAYERIAATHDTQRAMLAERARVLVETHAAAVERAQRAEVVLDLVRSAPGRALAAKLDTLAPRLGPVSIVATGEAIEVLIDGRPWALASTGRRIVSDAHFRDALRHAAGMEWLPIVVDEAQSVGGQPVHAPAPAWLIVTTDGPLEARPWTGRPALVEAVNTSDWPAELLTGPDLDPESHDGAWGDL